MRGIMWATLALLAAMVFLVRAIDSHGAGASDPVYHDREYATPEQKSTARRTVVANGYTCETVESMIPFAFGGGWHVWCERYRYDLEDHGGKWSVVAN